MFTIIQLGNFFLSWRKCKPNISEGESPQNIGFVVTWATRAVLQFSNVFHHRIECRRMLVSRLQCCDSRAHERESKSIVNVIYGPNQVVHGYRDGDAFDQSEMSVGDLPFDGDRQMWCVDFRRRSCTGKLKWRGTSRPQRCIRRVN